MNPQQPFSIHPRQLLMAFKNRGLIMQMSRREVIGRYKGSLFGLAWSFFNPLVMLLVYTFVFSVVFQARWNMEANSRSEFALALFIGMIVHGLVAECVNRAPGLILSNANYVKKVIFPLETLPIIAMCSTLFHTAISIGVWMLFHFIIHRHLQESIIFLPLILLPLVLFSLGLSWLLASLAVYVRDIAQMTGMFSTVLLFMSPVFYPASSLPLPYRDWLYLNPLTFIIEQSRAVTLFGKWPDWQGLSVAFAISLTVAWLGFAWFQKTRQGFADVL